MRTRLLSRPLLLATILGATPARAGAPPPPPDPRATLAQARARMAVAEYEEAADGLELFAQLSPRAAEAPDALKDAVVLRLGMGQREQAEKDADLFVKSYGATKPAIAAIATYALAADAIQREDHAAALKLLTGWVTTFDRSASLALRVQAHAALGRTHARLNDAKKAEAEYTVVRDLWRDPAGATEIVRTEGGDDRHLAKALTAVGEALFFFAEQTRRKAEAIHFPEYRGKPNKDEILEHLRTKVVAWVQKKRPAIEEAERAYLEVVEIQPAAPPRWVIASASRVGQLWGKFTAEFRAAPIPREWKGHGILAGTTSTKDELRRLYYGALDQASEPLKLRAKGAFKTCLSYSAKYAYSDDYARKCAEWLGKNYGGEYLPLTEILPRFGLLASGAALPEPVADPRPAPSPSP